MTHFPGLRILLYFMVLMVGCSREKNKEISQEYSGPEALGHVEGILEASGMVASRINKGMLWVHNDSGSDPEIYLIDLNGKIRDVFILANTKVRDWEDMAIGPGPQTGVSYIYLGEIGDNLAKWNEKMIYRFPEPKMDPQSQTDTIFSYDIIRFTYPDGNRDAETLMSDPVSKSLYIVSKREDSVHVYSLAYPQNTDTTNQVIFHGKIPYSKITAGDITMDGKSIILKNYQYIYYWNREENQPLFEVLKSPAQLLPYKEEPQGECLAWTLDGRGYLTLSEKNIFEDVILYGYYSK